VPARPPFVAGQTNTPLSPLDELAFRQWVASSRVPFDPNAQSSDYDMRGFWRAQQQQNPLATSATNPNDGQTHYPDYWKTPLHQSFSNESQWGQENDPRWINKSQLANSGGKVVFDETKPRDARQALIELLAKQ
jgi:hypothetical protein